MQIIGLTGGIGSGKSTIARGLQRRGYMVYLCDDEAKRVVVEDPAVRAQITQLLGPEVYQDGYYMTKVVRAKIAARPSLLDRLNAIIHPAVREDILHRPERPLFIETAILFESGLDSLCDCIVAVTAPETVRIARVLKRERNWTEDEVKRRMARQMSEQQLKAKADIVLCNDGTTSIEALVEQLLESLDI